MENRKEFDLKDIMDKAEQGDAEAQLKLGNVCRDEKSYEEAAKWFQRAAEQGNAKAQCNLGLCYNYGKGVEKDYELAVEWYRKAAEQGNAKAQFNLGCCYHCDEGVEKDYGLAVEWYRKAAEQGNGHAQVRLGYCYRKGIGVEKNLELAKEWVGKSTNTRTAAQERVELHCHTRANIPVYNFVRQAALCHNVIAITDHEVVQAFSEAFYAAQDRGIKIIYGVEINLLKNENLQGNYFLAILFAKNPAGLKNMYKLVSLSHTKYFREKPLIPQAVLAEHRNGLLVGSACKKGELYTAIYSGHSDEQLSEIAKFYDFLEIQPHETKDANRTITELGEKLHKPVVATGDVHFLEPVLLDEQECADADNQPPLYFKPTAEMLAEFAYLGENKAFEVVVTNTNLIADMIEEIELIPDDFFPPRIENADKEIVEICNARIKEIYGENIPDNVQKRLKQELDSILKNDYATIYIIAQKLVKKSNDDGYFVGYRGGMGASLAAYLLGITEIDPLEHNLPFEVFAGIDGERKSTIDLNFSRDYHLKIPEYVKELFGKDKVFSYVAENVLTGCCELCGVFILPEDKEIYDFTPVQYQENDTSSNVLITHLNYFCLSGTLLNVIIWPNDDTKIIKKLEDLTGVDVKTIPLDDKETFTLLKKADTLGVPELGSNLARKIIEKVTPKTFDDFVKISGLSHVKDTWFNNAENLIKSGTATLSEVIAASDEIMVYLIEKGINRETAFKIMEKVCKGNGVEKSHQTIMRKAGVPDWYIESCCKIKYLFPKAHAVAYTMTAFRIAWFKAHYPQDFYQAYFEVRNGFGGIDFMAYDISETRKRIAELETKNDSETSDDIINEEYIWEWEMEIRQEMLQEILQTRLEMLERGF